MEGPSDGLPSARGDRLRLREVDRVVEDGLASEHALAVKHPTPTVLVRHDAVLARTDNESIHADDMPARVVVKTERASECTRANERR